jgi:hypothetical protein
VTRDSRAGLARAIEPEEGSRRGPSRPPDDPEEADMADPVQGTVYLDGAEEKLRLGDGA